MSKQEDIQIFCQNIHQRREEAGLSAEGLAERSGAPREMLEALDRGILPREMDVGDAFALAKVFGCEVHDLFR